MGPKSRPKRSAADAAPYCPSRAERFFVAADPARTRRWHQEHDDHSYDLPADSTPLQRIQWRRFARRPEEGLRTAPSTIPNGGIGLFTDVLIYRGEIVSEYTGRRLSDEEYYARYAGKQPPEYCVGLGPHISIDLFFLSNGLCLSDTLFLLQRNTPKINGLRSRPTTDFIRTAIYIDLRPIPRQKWRDRAAVSAKMQRPLQHTQCHPQTVATASVVVDDNDSPLHIGPSAVRSVQCRRR